MTCKHIYELKQTHRHREQTCGCQQEEGWGGKDWELRLAEANYCRQNG